jgi:tripartite-type tricarboxylate transporter receptor subunit TctC
MRNAIVKVMLACGCLVLGSATLAQTFPNKPIKILVGFTPGGLTDVTARAVAKDLSDKFNQPVIVENRPGGGGQVATDFIARQPADGYTLVAAGSAFVIAPAIDPALRFDPVKDYEPVGVLVKSPQVVLVNPDLPIHSFKDFLQWGATQGHVPFATAGHSSQVTGEMLRLATGLSMTAVPYKGASEVMQAVASGQAPVAIQDLSSVAALVKAGKLRPIAITSAERSSLIPNVPTMAELGYKQVDTSIVLGLYMRSGAPPEIVTALNNAVRESLASANMQAFLKSRSVDPTPPMDVPQLRAMVSSEVAKWREMVRVTGVVLK